MINIILQHRSLSLLVCLIAGAITPLGLSPFNIWPLSLISLAIFALMLSTQPTSNSHVFIRTQPYGKDLITKAFAFAVGYFGVGVSWVFVSIYYFGSTHLLLAILLTTIFVLFVALVFALPFYIMRWVKPSLRLIIAFPLAWVVSEWLRTWFLTGFPWLFIGYSHIDTPLSGWAPIGGVLLVSLLSCLSSSAIALLLSKTHQHSLPPTIRSTVAICLLAIWAGGYGLSYIQWTESAGEDISVGLVQPNVPQNLRWSPDYQEPMKSGLRDLSAPLWKNDWIIWPEAAIPHTFHNSLDFINEINQLANTHNTVVITGVLYDEWNPDEDRTQYFNSIIGIGDASGIYHKQRLVPFGEYVPLEDWIRGVINFFDLPLSVISSGHKEQSNLHLGAYQLANAICYEIAYPQLVAQQAANSNVLLTVSNDAWFGKSIGPIQHFQMVRMRALETGRYIIRGTNNGVSAIIKPDGTVQAQSQQFIATTLESTIIPMQGNTPYMSWGNAIILSLLFILLCAGTLLPTPPNRHYHSGILH